MRPPLTPVSGQTSGDSRPGWLQTAYGVVAGYVLAGVCCFSAVFVLGLFGVFAPALTGARANRGLLDWPYPRHGAWTLAADLVALVVALCVVAGFVQSAAVWATGRRVAWWAIVVVLGITGYAPFVAYDGPLRLVSLAALVPTTALVRWRSFDAPPVRFDPRLVVPAVVLAAALTIGFGVTHPLAFSSRLALKLPVAPGRATGYGFDMQNSGLAAVEVLGFTTPDSRVAIVRADAGLTGASDRRSADGAIVDRHTTEAFTAWLQPRPGCTGRHLLVRRVVVRYRLLDRTYASALALSPPAVVPCD